MLLPHEIPHIQDLRRICKALGYGRVLQLVEYWWEESQPGIALARDLTKVERAMRMYNDQRWIEERAIASTFELEARHLKIPDPK